MKPTSVVLLSLFSLLSLQSIDAVDECPGFCPMEIDPVCGTDGKNYANSCELGVVSCNNPTLQLEVAYGGECVQTPIAASASCSILCTDATYEQCGTDGNTYANACVFALARCKDPTLKYNSSGPCKTHMRAL